MKETIFSFLYLSLFIVINVIVFLSTDSLHTDPLGYQENNLAYAHIFGAGQTTKNIDNYQIKFRTSPSVILADDVAGDLTMALTELQNVHNASASQELRGINQIVSDIDAILEEAVTIRIDKEQRNNATIQALAFAGIIDAVLRNYGDAYKVGFDTTDMLQMAIDDGMDNYTLVNMADYQNAQALTVNTKELFNNELKSLAPENKTNFTNKLESGLTQLNDAINNKALPMYIMMVVHTQVHPNLQTAYNLQLQ